MKPREPHNKVTRGVMNRVLAYAQDNTTDGFTQKDISYHTGVFHVEQILKLLERDGHRFRRVNEPAGTGVTTRYYLVQR